MRAPGLLRQVVARCGLASMLPVESSVRPPGPDARPDRLSLFAAIALRARPEWRGRPLLDDRPFLETAGFASNWSDALAGQPRRFAALDVHSIDRSVVFGTSSSVRALATVRIDEAWAYDTLYRSEIAATGILIHIDLHPQAMRAMVEFLEAEPGLDHGSESRSILLLRFPVRRAISFPEARGLANPYDGSTESFEKPKAIATLRIDSLEAVVTVCPSSPAVVWESQPLGPLVAGSSVLSLSL